MTSTDYDIERAVYQTPSNDDDLYDEYDDEEGFGRGPVFAIFAVIVLAAFVGIVWLAYQQGLRQGQMSSPPIITASADPIKVEPENPQGMAEPVETLADEVLAGAAPAEEVAAVTSSREEPLEVPPPSLTTSQSSPDLRASSASEPTDPNADSPLIVPAPSEGIAVAGSDAATAGPPAGIGLADEPAAQAALEQEAVSEPVVEDEPAEVETAGLMTVPPPSTGPAVQDTPQGPPALGPVEETVAARPANVAPTPIYLVQVASVPERANADAVWQTLQNRYVDIVAGYAQDVRAVDLGERGTWYRLRIGFFASQDDATRVCNELKDAGQDCLVTSE